MNAPSPTLNVSVPSAHLLITTAETDTITVEVAPGHAWRPADQRAADRVHTTREGEDVSVTAPPASFLDSGTVRITATVPVGTRVDSDTGNGAVRATGDLGACTLRTGNGSLSVEGAAELDAETSNGAITLGTVTGECRLRTASGAVRAEQLGGVAEIHTSNGAVRVRKAGPVLQAETANGSLHVDEVDGDVTLRTTNGSIRVGSVGGGALTANTSNGRITVGVAAGVSPWVDAQTHAGKVVNELTPTDGPRGERTAEIRVRTMAGSILLYRPGASRAA